MRHERLSVAVALAEALHDSAGPREKVVERREAPEGEVRDGDRSDLSRDAASATVCGCCSAGET